MRDTSDGVCPECGWVLEVGVLAANVEQRRALWVMCGWPVAIGVSVVVGSALYALGWETPLVFEIWLAKAYAAVVLSLFAYGLLGVGALVFHRGRAFRRAHRWLRIGWGLLLLLCVLFVLLPVWVVG